MVNVDSFKQTLAPAHAYFGHMDSGSRDGKMLN